VNILETIIAGIAGTALMSLVMTLVHRADWARADMIRALGSYFTDSYERSVAPGLLVHYIAGIVLAFPYVIVLDGLDVLSPWGAMAIGGLIGFVHGFMMAFVLIAVSDSHPVERFRGAGFEIAGAHLVGHIAYGIGVAGVAAAFHIDYGFRFSPV